MESLEPIKGRLLIAEPSILNDASFNRSVILLTEHNQVSSIGFIMNKPLEYTIKDLVPELECYFRVYKGGPVEQDNLYFIHKIPHLLPNSIQVANGIYWGGDFDTLVTLINSNKVQSEDIRFFLGYSGWGEGQLIEELACDSWVVVENNALDLFSSDTKNIWQQRMLELGDKYKIWANAPIDPNLN